MLVIFTLPRAMRVFQQTIPGSSSLFRTGDMLPKGSEVVIGDIEIRSYDHRDKLAVSFERDGQKGVLLLEEISRDAWDSSSQWTHFHNEAAHSRIPHNKNEAVRREEETKENLTKLLRKHTRAHLRIATKQATR